MLIKMLRNKHGSPDGHSVQHYEDGQEYDLPQALADAFIEERVAEAAEPQDPEAAAKAAAEKAEKAERAAAEKAAKAEKAAAEKAEKALKNKAEKALSNKAK